MNARVRSVRCARVRCGGDGERADGAVDDGDA